MPRRDRSERIYETTTINVALTLMRRENVLGHFSNAKDDIVGIFVKRVKDPMSQEQVELILEHYLATSKHNDHARTLDEYEGLARNPDHNFNIN